MSISVRVGRESSLAEAAAAAAEAAAAEASRAAGVNRLAEHEPDDDNEAELIREARALMAAGRLQ